MKVGIVGAGSIGLLLAYKLADKHDVNLFVRRQEQKDKINKEGITEEPLNSSRKITALFIQEKIDVDLLFVTVKGNQIANIISALKQHHLKVPIVFLQNGLGHLQYLSELKAPIILGVVEHGAIRKADHLVEHTGKGTIKLARYSTTREMLHQVITSLHQADFPFYQAENWQELLFDKLIVNAVINPLTAIFEVKNGALLENQALNYLAKALCKETAAILNLNESSQWQRIQEIASNTGRNTSSMLADIIAKRQTEIEAISGYILAHTKIPAPLTDFVYHGVKTKEEKG